MRDIPAGSIEHAEPYKNIYALRRAGGLDPHRIEATVRAYEVAERRARLLHEALGVALRNVCPHAARDAHEQELLGVAERFFKGIYAEEQS